jgi:hypothetical protein
VLPHPLVVPQALWFDATDDALALLDQSVEVLVAPDIELPEPVEELGQVVHRAVAERLRLAVTLPSETFRQVGNQLLQFLHESLLGQSHGLVEPCRDAFALLLVQVGMQLLQVIRWFNAKDMFDNPDCRRRPAESGVRRYNRPGPLEDMNGFRQLKVGNAMRLHRTCVLGMLVLVTVTVGYSAQPDAGQESAIAEIKKLGGKTVFDEASPQRLLIGVDLCDTQVTDAGLVLLKGLTQLQSLDLSGTEVTDAGLEHLKGLTQLHTLELMGTKITNAGLEHLEGLTQLQGLDLSHLTEVTDAGLVHLKGLTQLHTLDLSWTKVTDAGLVHLKGLTQLQTLSLFGTEVTGAGIQKLRQALPNCKTVH